MNSDKPIAAKIVLPLKSQDEAGEAFIGLSGTLYQNHLIYSEPRELRRADISLELIVVFRSRDSFANWISHPKIKEYWSTKFEVLLSDAPSTREETDVIIELDTVENCQCSTSEFFILQGRSFQFIDELTCASCLKQVSYSRVPIEIGIEQWQNYHQRFYLNWLDSGLFEKDALTELTDYKGSKLSKEGERIRAEISQHFKAPAYLNYFAEELDESHHCPICNEQGTPSGLEKLGLICKKCNTIFN